MTMLLRREFSSTYNIIVSTWIELVWSTYLISWKRLYILYNLWIRIGYFLWSSFRRLSSLGLPERSYMSFTQYLGWSAMPLNASFLILCLLGSLLVLSEVGSSTWEKNCVILWSSFRRLSSLGLAERSYMSFTQYLGWSAMPLNASFLILCLLGSLLVLS